MKNKLYFDAQPQDTAALSRLMVVSRIAPPFIRGKWHDNHTSARTLAAMMRSAKSVRLSSTYIRARARAKTSEYGNSGRERAPLSRIASARLHGTVGIKHTASRATEFRD